MELRACKSSASWSFNFGGETVSRIFAPRQLRLAWRWHRQCVVGENKPMSLTQCPCGRTDLRSRSLAYTVCCGRYLDHFAESPAPDAESLMRSRYTAFAEGRADYLLATWHPSQRPATLELDGGTRFRGREVRSRHQRDGTHAEVEFVARQRDAGGRAHRLHERSRFVHEDGRWFYVDGEVDPAR